MKNMGLIIGVLSLVVTIAIALFAGLWKLATKIGTLDARTENEFKRNGGGSIKDDLHAIKDAVAELRDAHVDMREDMQGVKETLHNGLRSDVRRSAALAGEAASTSARAIEVAENAIRATNQLRAELNVITDAVIDDRARIWKALAVMGFDRRQAAIDDDGHETSAAVPPGQMPPSGSVDP